MSGIQSTKVMCTVEPLRADLEKTEASMKKKKPRENYIDSQSRFCEGIEVFVRAYECASEVDACCPCGSAV